MKKEAFMAIDLGSIQDSLIKAKHCMDVFNDGDRSAELREIELKKAQDIIETLIRDCDYFFDTKTFNGILPKGLEISITEE